MPVKLEMPPFSFTTNDADDVQYGWVICHKCRVLFLPFDARTQTKLPLHSEYCHVAAAKPPAVEVQKPITTEGDSTTGVNDTTADDNAIEPFLLDDEDTEQAVTKRDEVVQSDEAKVEKEKAQVLAKRPQYPHEPSGIRYGIPYTKMRPAEVFKSCWPCGCLYYAGEVRETEKGQTTSRGPICTFANPESADDRRKYIEIAGFDGTYGHLQNTQYYIVKFEKASEDTAAATQG